MSDHKDKILQSIYVDLDSLLDTRIGTISKISDEAALNVLLNDYHSREIDVFKDIDMGLYKELYAKRDIETLKRSYCTSMVKVIKDIAIGLNEQAIMRPFHEGAKITVNYYPYNLNSDEIEEFRKVITMWINGVSDVELITISTKDLTPLLCRNTYALLIMYDYDNWLNTHATSFAKTLMPETTLLGPALYFNKKPTEDELANAIKKHSHPFRATETLASALIGLELIDVKHFSIVKPE